MTAQAETLVVMLTPAGRGAIATLLVDGPHALEHVAAHFHAAGDTPLDRRPIGRVVVGRWGAADGEEVVTCRRSPEQVEVHCHGGLAAAGAIIDRLVTSGCRRLDWNEWLAQRPRDPIQAAAQCALADSQTERTAAILLDQYAGALREAFNQVEAALAADDRDRAPRLLDDLLQYADLGLHLARPWRVVLAGRPNVGKSSLINALVGYQRAIVFDQPGTTRDVVTATTALGGWPVELVDTAGLCASAADPVEAAGVRRAEEQLEMADLVVLVFDATRKHAEDESSLTDAWPEALRVDNKYDLVAAPSGTISGSHSADPSEALPTSARTGEGIEQLATSIADRLVPRTPPAGAAVPFTADQIDALRTARAALAEGDLDRSIESLRALGA